MPVPTDGHRERMRTRAEQMDPGALRSQDMLEFLLFYALPRRDTKPYAFALLERFGSVEAVLNAEEEELCSVKGIGQRTARWLRSLGGMLEAYSELEPDDRPALSSCAKAVVWLKRLFSGVKHEEVWQFCLNAGGRMLGRRKLADFACWRSVDYVRDAFEMAMSSNANAVIICHYTTGEIKPIEDDERQALLDYGYTLSVTGILLLDHITLNANEYHSMFESGEFDGMMRPSGTGRMCEAYLDGAAPEDMTLNEDD